MYILYIDDSIIIAPTQREVNLCIKEIQNTGLKLTDEGPVEDFLGVHFNRKEKDVIHISQPNLTNSILKELHLDKNNSKCKNIPMSSSKILSRHPNST